VKNPESIYNQFVEFEEKAAGIYLQFASRFYQDPELSSFWLEIAMHEKQHAGLLQFCLCQKLFAPDLPQADDMEKLAVFFESLERRVADPNLTVQQAFSIALEMETSEINAIYCNLTTSLHKSMYLLRRKIATSLPDHIDELTRAAQKFGVGENALETLRREKERCVDVVSTDQ
jgi:rubrerythrin